MYKHTHVIILLACLYLVIGYFIYNYKKSLFKLPVADRTWMDSDEEVIKNVVLGKTETEIKNQTKDVEADAEDNTSFYVDTAELREQPESVESEAEDKIAFGETEIDKVTKYDVGTTEVNKQPEFVESETEYNIAFEETNINKLTKYDEDMAGINNQTGLVKSEAEDKINFGETDVDKFNKYDVILNAYKHSGSTATGCILGHREDTFYVHEPLWQVATHTFYKGPCKLCKDFHLDPQTVCTETQILCPNRTSETVDFPKDSQDKFKDYKTLNESLEFLQSILDCDFHRFSKFFFDPDSQMAKKETLQSIFYHGSGWNKFKECRKKRLAPFTGCLKLAENSCRAAKHKVIKLLRITLDNLEVLLKRNPRLKIIQLFRDPRGIFNSQIGKALYPINDKNLERIRPTVKIVCERLQIDFETSKMLKSAFPNRVKIIQYERFFSLPILDADGDLYNFAKMEYDIKQQSVGKTQCHKSSNQVYGFHPFNYRTKLPWVVIEMFNEECSGVLDILGYARYEDNEHLKDMSRPGLVSKD